MSSLCTNRTDEGASDHSAGLPKPIVGAVATQTFNVAPPSTAML